MRKMSLFKHFVSYYFNQLEGNLPEWTTRGRPCTALEFTHVLMTRREQQGRGCNSGKPLGSQDPWKNGSERNALKRKEMLTPATI